MFRFIFVCLLFCSINVYSQLSVSDSLMNSLQNAKEEEKIEIYIELSKEYKYRSPDSAHFFAKQAYDQAKKTGDQFLLATTCGELGSIYLETSRYEFAFSHYDQARALFQELGKEKDLAKVLNDLGFLFYRQEDYERALDYTQQSIEIGRRINDKESIAFSLGNLADIYYRQNKGEEAIANYKQSLQIYEELGDSEKIASTLNRIGNYYSSRAEFESANEYYMRVLEIRRESGDPRSIGIVLTNIGNQCLQLGKYDLAIDHYKEASEIFKEISFDAGTAATLTGMAVIYENQQQFKAALEVYKEVLAIREKQGNKREMANTLSNIGVTYSLMFNDSLKAIYGQNYSDSVFLYGKAPDIEYAKLSIDYNLRALEFRHEINDNYGLAITLANLGNTYEYLGDVEQARQYFNRWLELPEETQDDDTKVAIRIGLGKLAMQEGNHNTAIVYFNQALRLASRINKKYYIKIITENLAYLYEKEGDFTEALKYYKHFHSVYDSLNQERTREVIHDMQVKYETDAIEKNNALLRKDQEIQETKLRNSRMALTAAIIVVLIFIGLVIQLIRQNNFRRKANLELARKNQLITEQTKEITDSIQYASRIQNAILPPDEVLNQLLPQHFIIYRPRDIVSGDYFWITEKNNKVITIVADCTGHGVPGAFMSMLGVAFLNEIVSKHDEIHVDMILNELRSQVIHSLHQTGRQGENQDGMDVALFIIDRDTKELEYAGANNPLLIFRGEEMIELKADKMPIGIHTNVSIPFEKKTMKLQKGDMLYAFSDGYHDQFGGPQGKKFMIKNFKKLLAQIYNETLTKQKEILEYSLDDWMKETKQIDDILVMGVKI